MLVWVYGVGGVGSIVCGRLAPRMPDLLLIEDWQPHLEELNRVGLKVQFPDGEISTGPLHAISSKDIARQAAPPDVVLLCVKAYDVPAAARALAPHLGQAGVVVSLQNGIVTDTLSAEIGPSRTIASSVMFDGELIAPGRARQLRRKPIIIGRVDGPPDETTSKVAELLCPVAPTETSSDIEAVLWSKLVNNTANALTAIADLGAGRLLEQSPLREIWIGLVAEAIRVAMARNVRLDPALIYGGPPSSYLASPFSRDGRMLRTNLTREFAAFPDLRSTMLQDLSKGRRTEVDALNGYVVSAGAPFGCDTRLNAAVIPVIKRLESRWRPSPDEREQILAQLASDAG